MSAVDSRGSDVESDGNTNAVVPDVVVASGADTGANSGSDAGGIGICTLSCSKSCMSDVDCQTNNGELCCHYGSAGNVCQSASSCPQYCTSNSMCDTAHGQACVATSLAASAQRECRPASEGLTFCRVDSDCVNGNVCCTIYNQAICLPTNQCPKACATSTDCQTSASEVCCTSVTKLEPSLNATGLCLNPAFQTCPKACTQSSECTRLGELCCNGICLNTCPKSCSSDNDCSSTNRICCSTYLASPPVAPQIFHSGA